MVGTTIDGGVDPLVTARRVRNMVDRGAIHALVGWHTSAIRQQIVSLVGGRVPYVYTAVYEGGENSSGVYVTGEVPDGLIAALAWMATEGQARSWFVIGSDYVWPRGTVQRLREQIYRVSAGRSVWDEIEIVQSAFVPLGTENFAPLLDSIERSGVDGVVVLLLGQDAVTFNRAFAERHLHRDIVRLGSLIDENMLLAGGVDAGEELYSVSGYFESLVTGSSLDFGARYTRRFGVAAPPLTAPGESCYEGVSLLAKLTQQAGSTDVPMLDYHSQSALDYDDSPRGHVRLEHRHLSQDVYLARADGLDFEVVTRVGSA